MITLKHNFYALCLLVSTLLVTCVFASTKTKPPTVYYITHVDFGDVYSVTTQGYCIDGTDPCYFSTYLPPDKPGGRYSKTYLFNNGVIIVTGIYKAGGQ